MRTLNEKMKKLSTARRKKIARRAAVLAAEELSLRDLRLALKRTQTELAKALGITQDQVSRLEQRSDVLLSTLRKYIEGMGGSLSLIAEFPDRDPVVLAGIAEMNPERKQASGRKRAHAHA